MMHTEKSTPLSAAQIPVYIGMMSGTSLDGVDGVLVRLPVTQGDTMELLASAYIPFSEELRRQALQLQQPGENEIHHEALLANALAHSYTTCTSALLSNYPHLAVRAIGVHGQTIRHRPELGFTRQTNNPALLAELTSIDVIADFRSRDVAAGGQGAPLVPAFHQAVFGSDSEARVAVNIGGISNISILLAGKLQATSGFDTGPGNVLMDAWIARHQGQSYDADGAWGASGKVDAALLHTLRQDAYFALPPPKSTGRDLFHSDWLDARVQGHAHLPAADVQATLTAFTAATITDAIVQQAPHTAAVYVCGGGAYNTYLLQLLAQGLGSAAGREIPVYSTAALGVAPNHVEALAFAWLAQRFCLRLPGNLPAVTGARGLRVLGGLYPVA